MTARAVLLLYLSFLGLSLPVQGAPVLRAGLTAENWTTFQGDQAHDGSTSDLLEPDLFEVAWQRSVSTQPLSQAVEGDGRVFVSVDRYVAPPDAPHLFALDVLDGSLAWSKSFGPVFSINPPAYAYGNVYLQTGRPPGGAALLRAIDATTGNTVFTTEFGAQAERYLAPTIADGAVYVNGGFFGGLYRFDAFSGEIAWFTALSQFHGWTPTLDADRAYTYAGGVLTAVDRQTGATEYALRDPGFVWNSFDMRGAIALSDNDMAVTIHNGRLIRFDLATPAIVWDRVGAYSGHAAVRTGLVYALNAGELEALALSNGAGKWTWKPPAGEMLSGNVIATRAHVIVSSATNTYVINSRSRLVEYTFAAGGALSLGAEHLYIAGRDGVVTAIALPVSDAGTPVALVIAGPSRVGENTAVRYRATVTYDDGTRLDRTSDAEWQIDNTEVASVRAAGVLSVVELFSPDQEITLTARYKEDGIVLSASRQIALFTTLTDDEFALRGLERARAITRSVAEQLAEAARQQASAQTALPDGHPAGDDLSSAAEATERARNESQTAAEHLDGAINEFGPVP